jgi:hypothetical protein
MTKLRLYAKLIDFYFNCRIRAVCCMHRLFDVTKGGRAVGRALLLFLRTSFTGLSLCFRNLRRRHFRSHFITQFCSFITHLHDYA